MEGKVERWYQLDAFAYGLVQAYTAWKPKLEKPPAMIWLASPEASNETDLQFARGGAQSPAKFVHTLPNVRCSPLCQVMEWAGPVLCIQKDPYTQSHALMEAAAFLEHGSENEFGSPIWVLSVFRVQGSYRAQVFILSRALMSGSDGKAPRYKIVQTHHQTPLQKDSSLQEWADSKIESFPLPGGSSCKGMGCRELDEPRITN